MSIKQTDQVRAPTTKSTHKNTPSSAAEELQQHTHLRSLGWPVHTVPSIGKSSQTPTHPATQQADTRSQWQEVCSKLSSSSSSGRCEKTRARSFTQKVAHQNRSVLREGGPALCVFMLPGLSLSLSRSEFRCVFSGVWTRPRIAHAVSCQHTHPTAADPKCSLFAQNATTGSSSLPDQDFRRN